MDEYLRTEPVKPETAAAEVNTNINSEAENVQPKRVSLKSAESTLVKLQKKLQQKTDKIAELKKEISGLNTEIRLQAQTVKKIREEEAERKLAEAFRRLQLKNMTEAQISKAMLMVQTIFRACDNDNFDKLDAGELAKIICTEAEKKRESSQPASAGFGGSQPQQTENPLAKQN